MQVHDVVARPMGAFAILALCAGSALGVPATFDRVVSADEVLPNGQAVDHLARPVMDGQRVLFSNGLSSSFQTGLYLWNGSSLETVLAAGDTMPGGSAEVQRVLRHDMVGGRAVYTAFGAGFDIALFERSGSGAVTRLADTDTPRPDGQDLAFPLWTAIDSGRVVLTDLDGGGNAGVYGVREGEPMERIYDYRVPAPLGNPPLRRIGSVGAHNGTVVFQGRSDFGTGVYALGPTSGARIAQSGQFVPNVGFISDIDEESVSYHSGIATFAVDLGTDFQGAVMIANDDGSNLRAMATLDSFVPGRGDGMTFRDGLAQFGDTATHAGAVVFEVDGQNGTSGLYFRDDEGFLSVLVNTETMLDGRHAFSFDISGHSFDGTSVAFIASFGNDDGTISQEVYVARVPAPCTLAGLGLAGLMSCQRRQRGLS